MNPAKQRSTVTIPGHAMKTALGVGLVIVITIAAAAAYIWFSGGSGQPTTTIRMASLERHPGDTRMLFQLIADESEVRFLIDETLLGAPTTVIGVTNEIAGEMLVDPRDLSKSEISPIRINLRTLETDNEFRNRAIRGQIFEANQPEYEFAEFIVTELVGMPTQIKVGQSVTIDIVGQFLLHGVTREVKFESTLELTSSSRLEGMAHTVVRYEDFGIRIPEAPGVADVSETVQLEFDFVAEAITK
jgi:polyisoprenoid-binding protein YceI